MARVSISEAARLTGKSRTTLHRLIKTGDLSTCSGERNAKMVDTSELLRVFGPFEQPKGEHGVVCGRGRNPTLRLWPTIFSGKIDVFPGDRRSRLISSMTSVAPA